MRTMLWKELRENFKWAVLAFLALTAAELYTLSAPRQEYVESYTDLTLCSSAFLLATAFGCSAIGVALALVQILPELRRDQWAALLHRPVPRETIFFGKVLAGMLLYIGATLPPFAIAVTYVAMPGQFAAPLVPGMVTPGLSDLFLGPVFYFATLLVCLHRGSGWASRTALGLSVIPIFVEHLTSGWPFLIPIASALAYLVAARGAVLNNGTLQNWPRAGRLMLPLIVVLGTETAVLIGMASLEFLPSKATAVQARYTTFEVGQDGKVYLMKSDGEGSILLTDTEGNPIADPGGKKMNFSREILPLCWQFRGSKSRSLYLTQSPRNLFNYIQEFNEPQGKEIWYLLTKQNYFVGYDKLSRRPVGICDVGGFKPPNATPKPFPQRLEVSVMDFQAPHLFWSGTQVVALDFPDRTMTSFEVGNEAIYGANPLLADYMTEKPLYIAVALGRELQLFNAAGTLLLSLPYPHDPAIWSNISIGSSETGDRIYLESADTSVFLFSNSNAVALPQPVFLDVFDAQGHLLNTYQQPDTSVSLSSPSWNGHLLTWISPFLPALAGTIYSNLFPSPVITDADLLGYFTIPKPALSGVSPQDLAILCVLGSGLGVLAFVWGRRNGFSTRRAGLWALFVLCFGLPGLVAFRLASDWPTRVRCLSCGGKRTLREEECPECHRAWPAPPSTGLEIFEKAGPISGPEVTAGIN
jgi:hypothetical protein